MVVTPAIADIFQQAGSTSFYAPNGPSNEFYGGKSLALKRLARECSE
jgi:hypothetical protein